MAWLEADAPNIATGWGPPPHLDAPPIGQLVHAALYNQLAQRKMAQESISDAIKTMQQQRQDAAYIQAAQQAGLLPQGDLSGLGRVGGASLAGLIQTQKEREAQATLRNAMANYYRSGGRGGGDGGLGGKEWVQDADGNWHLVTGNAALRAAQQGDAENPYEERFQMVTTPDMVTYWNKDYSRKLSSEEAGADANAIAVLPNKVTMPYADYKKLADRLVNKYYQYKTQGQGSISQDDVNQAQQALDKDTPLPAGPSAPPPATTATPAPQTTPTPEPRTTPADQNVAKGYGRPLGPSQRGYQAGKTYGGRRYFGGDPNDPNNWE